MPKTQRFGAALSLSFFLTSFASGAANPDWFPKKDLTTIGAYYYPEAWPESQWARDMANIHKLGMEFVHMGEFAWYFMEPQEGQFHFEWLDKNIDLAAKNGLKVILCTPSAAPPIWLTRNHPEVLMLMQQAAPWSTAAGNKRTGAHRFTGITSRRSIPNSPNAMGMIDVFGDGRSTMSSVTTESVSLTRRRRLARFRDWLKEKYGSIDRLNTDWGGAFWSEMYQNFDQIEIPNEQVLVADPSPHAVLDFRRWFAHEAANYIDMQAATLRQYSENQWVTTNFMAMHEDVNPVLSRLEPRCRLAGRIIRFTAT